MFAKAEEVQTGPVYAWKFPSVGKWLPGDELSPEEQEATGLRLPSELSPAADQTETRPGVCLELPYLRWEASRSDCSLNAISEMANLSVFMRLESKGSRSMVLAYSDQSWARNHRLHHPEDRTSVVIRLPLVPGGLLEPF